MGKPGAGCRLLQPAVVDPGGFARAADNLHSRQQPSDLGRASLLQMLRFSR